MSRLVGVSMRTLSSRIALAALAALLAAPALAAAPGSTRLDPASLSALRARQPARAALARSTLLDARASLGLADGAGFDTRSTFTGEDGRTVVRLRQTHLGKRVLGGEAIVHVERDGTVRTLTRGVKTDAVPAGEPRLSADQAIAAALRRLAPRGPLTRPPAAELVVFPTRFTGDLVVSRDPSTGRLHLDRDLSVRARRPAAPAVWAWEVKTLVTNLLDGHKELTYVVDASSGEVLRISNELVAAGPATGTGHGWYRGDLPVSAFEADDGTFSLVSKAHGTLPNPFVLEQGVDWTGLTTAYSWINVNDFTENFDAYAGNATNSWGNGEVYRHPVDPDTFQVKLEYSLDGSQAWLSEALQPPGQTPAVDAHAGLSSTWDFYREVFDRDGIDGQGTSTFAVVHALVNGFFMTDNAFWSRNMFGMFFGNGTAGTLYEQPWSLEAVTELDITGHELTHGVTFATADLAYEGESGGLNEATSDILGKMVQAWVEGGSSGATVPDFEDAGTGPWVIGGHSVTEGSQPLRFMYKPSKDGISIDEWYDGVGGIDVHFSSGIGNRFFYFLARGGSAEPASDSYSPYLPGGMTGIGNEKAARIYYKALTEYFLSDTGYAAARDLTLEAAADLHGAGSAEVLAVQRAWAAVNVGEAPGEAPRIRVRMPVMNPPGSFLYDNAFPEGVLEKVQLFPTRTRVMVTALVENTGDTRVTIESPADVMAFTPWTVGTIAEDGSWVTPWFSYYSDLIEYVVRSKADPLQYAKGRTVLVELDGNTDGEMDVFDLAATAMEWGLPGVLHQAVATSGSGTVDDWDLVFWTQGFHNGFPAR